MNPTDAALLVAGGQHDGESMPLGPRLFSIGRQQGIDLFIDDVSASRQHAEIVEKDGDYYLRDLASTNGTFVNGHRMGDKELLLQDEDKIRVAGSEVTYVFRYTGYQTQQLTVALSTDRPPDVTVEEDAPDSVSVESGELYDGTVRLRVVGDTGLLVEFAKNLRNKPGLRLLRLAKHGNGDMGLWVGLREPMDLTAELRTIAGVSNVSTPGGRDLSPKSQDNPLTVLLDLQNPERCYYCGGMLRPGSNVCDTCRKTMA